eukprot:2446656-Prymnesium_polylepis.1
MILEDAILSWTYTFVMLCVHSLARHPLMCRAVGGLRPFGAGAGAGVGAGVGSSSSLSEHDVSSI